MALYDFGVSPIYKFFCVVPSQNSIYLRWIPGTFNYELWRAQQHQLWESSSFSFARACRRPDHPSGIDETARVLRIVPGLYVGLTRGYFAFCILVFFSSRLAVSRVALDR